MIDPDSPISEKKDILQGLVARAKKKVEGLGDAQADSKSSKEQQMLEGKQAPDEKAIDDLKTAVEELTSAVEKIDTRSSELKNALQQQLIEMREMYARKAYYFVWIWSIALIVILLLQGSKSPSIQIWSIELRASDFNLDPKVLIALISGVTVNIVAVFVVVMRNLFPSDPKLNNKEKKKNNK